MGTGLPCHTELGANAYPVQLQQEVHHVLDLVAGIYPMPSQPSCAQAPLGVSTTQVYVVVLR